MNQKKDLFTNLPGKLFMQVSIFHWWWELFLHLIRQFGKFALIVKSLKAPLSNHYFTQKQGLLKHSFLTSFFKRKGKNLRKFQISKSNKSTPQNQWIKDTQKNHFKTLKKKIGTKTKRDRTL